MKTKSISIVVLCLVALVGGCELVPGGTGFPRPNEPCYDLGGGCVPPPPTRADLG